MDVENRLVRATYLPGWEAFMVFRWHMRRLIMASMMVLEASHHTFFCGATRVNSDATYVGS